MAIDTSNNLNSLAATYLAASAVNAALNINGVAGNSSTAIANQNALQRATELAADASVVVSLSNANLLNQTQALTYNPAGLLNAAVALNSATSVAQAIAAANDAAQAQQDDATPGLDSDQASNLFYAGVLSGLATAPSTASLYTPNGNVTGIDTAYATQLAQVLQANPDLADTISGDIAAQGVTGALLSVTA